MSSHPAASAAPSRSHRQLAEQLDLLHFPAYSPGMACWHPKGIRVLDVLHAYIRELNERYGYQEVRAPLVCDQQLWARSGHLEKFADKMFHLDVDGRPASLKPMNCPGHCDLFAHRPRSYRDLPMRIAEQGHVHRAEQSGTLNGLLRARSFVIDDGHLFCAPDQVPAELAGCLRMAAEVYRQFDLPLSAELSLRPEQRLGDDRLWDRAEQALRDALSEAGIAFAEQPGEGAFYGPKVDLHVQDSLGRAWQMGSVQLDYQLPERFDLRYVSADGSDHDANGRPYRPVIIHRAMLGSFERFVGILLEHLDGRLPLWLAPEQVRVLPIGGEQHPHAREVAAAFNEAGVRSRLIEDGPLGGRIRDGQADRIPVLAIVGAKEQADGAVSLRSPQGQVVLALDAAAALLGRKVRDRSAV